MSMHTRAPLGPAGRAAGAARRVLRRFATPAALLAAVLAPAAALLADTITYKSGTTTATQEVQIQSFESGELVYASGATGRITKKPLDSIVTIKANGETRLNAAEEAYAAGKWEDAAKGYNAVLESSDKAWAKARATVRLIDSAGKSGQFSMQAKAYIVLSGINLPEATRNKPVVPRDKPDEVKAAIEDVDRALINAAIKPERRELLQNFKAELLLAAGRGKEASRILNATPPPAAGNTGGAGAAMGAAPADEAGRKVAAGRALLIAEQSIQQRNYPAAAQAIESAKASFTDPAQQAKALWDLAVVKEQTAGNDPAKLQDAAIAYIRIVAHFEDKPELTNIGGALMKAAEIEERLNKPDEALQIYDQIAKDPKLQNTWGAAATKKAQELKAKAK